MDMDESLAVRSYSGKQSGLMEVAVVPFSKEGLILQDECVEDPDEMIGSHFQFQIHVKRILDLPQNFTQVSRNGDFVCNDLMFELNRTRVIVW